MDPFVFRSRVCLTELTTLKARTARQLLDAMRRAPETAIYHHTHRYLERHRILSPEPTNDFAYWARHALGDSVLGEMLASVDVTSYASLEELRAAFIERLTEFVKQSPARRRSAHPGEEFRFMKSRTFIFPTGLEATTLPEFLEALDAVTVHSLYYHMFEARLRLKRPANDFSAWFESSLEKPALAAAVARLDPYTHTLEGLRQSVAAIVRREILREGDRA